MSSEHKLTHLDKKIDSIETAISEISAAVQTLAAAEVRNADTAQDMKSIRAKLQTVAEHIAGIPTKEEYNHLTDRVSDLGQRLSSAESSIVGARSANAATTRIVYAVGSLIGVLIITVLSVYLNH